MSKKMRKPSLYVKQILLFKILFVQDCINLWFFKFTFLFCYRLVYFMSNSSVFRVIRNLKFGEVVPKVVFKKIFLKDFEA